MQVIGFDVFATLVDPTGIAEPLRPFAGERTDALVDEWRRSQLEYAFRRAAMGRYRPFDRVTRAALDRALTITGIDIPEADREELVAAWARYSATPEPRHGRHPRTQRAARLACLTLYIAASASARTSSQTPL